MFFSKFWLYSSRALLKIYKTFSYNLSHHIKYACFQYYQMPKSLILNTHKEYPHLFLINFVDYLNTHLFFNWRFHVNINNVWYFTWLHIIIYYLLLVELQFHKIYLFLHTFSWDLSLFSLLKEWSQLKQ